MTKNGHRLPKGKLQSVKLMLSKTHLMQTMKQSLQNTQDVYNNAEFNETSNEIEYPQKQPRTLDASIDNNSFSLNNLSIIQPHHNLSESFEVNSNLTNLLESHMQLSKDRELEIENVMADLMAWR